MRKSKQLRLLAAVLVVASVVLPPKVARAQWIEAILGTWAFWAFGSCPSYGCMVGPRLCATVEYSSGLNEYCYQM